MKDVRDKVFVAVYGTLMRGERNERWREGVRTWSRGTMRGRLFDTGYGFPAFVPDPKGGPVTCEVLRVDEAQLQHMDVLEGYPNLYDRRTVTVSTCQYGNVDAIVYVMNRLPAQAVRIESGDWCGYRRDRARDKV